MNQPNHFPKMLEVEQTYPASPKLDFLAILQQQFRTTGLLESIKPGMRLAVGVGSRGITNIKEIAAATLKVLIDAGAKPFLIPAMGSHGGATPEGQLAVLASYGITPQSMGVPIEASMEVKKIGTGFGELDVVLSVPALAADGIVVLNRVKPHTDFRGNLGSGIQKMLVIGFGKQVGANNAHRASAHRGYENVLREFAKTILGAAPVFCGIALLEDQHHQTAEISVLPAKDIVREEDRLFQKASLLLPRLPLEEIDLLIVDRMGKDISGSGMDTNVIGRDINGYSSSLHDLGPIKPQIGRIFVRDLTPASSGNGQGLGLADFTTTRLVKSLNLQYMYMNALTSLGIQPAKIPIYFDNDREAIHAALASMATPDPEKLRVVRIADTLTLDKFLASESCVSAMQGRSGVSPASSAHAMQFDATNNLLPL
jgi:hypothetical protein